MEQLLRLRYQTQGTKPERPAVLYTVKFHCAIVALLFHQSAVQLFGIEFLFHSRLSQSLTRGILVNPWYKVITSITLHSQTKTCLWDVQSKPSDLDKRFCLVSSFTNLYY